MNVALIFAGGTGTRMNSSGKPKQFLELHNKPIIIHTIEHFDKHPDIDYIAVVCIEDWIEYFKQQLIKFRINKVRWIVPGGSTSQESTRNGLNAIASDLNPEETIVLIHDGVRPLINAHLISANIDCVKLHRNAITIAPANETIVTLNEDGYVSDTLPRNNCRLARAPQSFILADIIRAHQQASKDKYELMIDSASLMIHYGQQLFTVDGPAENIKITTPTDFYIFRAILEAQENLQIIGI